MPLLIIEIIVLTLLTVVADISNDNTNIFAKIIDIILTTILTLLTLVCWYELKLFFFLSKI